jgi:hypothetical protein
MRDNWQLLAGVLLLLLCLLIGIVPPPFRTENVPIQETLFPYVDYTPGNLIRGDEPGCYVFWEHNYYSDIPGEFYCMLDVENPAIVKRIAVTGIHPRILSMVIHFQSGLYRLGDVELAFQDTYIRGIEGWYFFGEGWSAQSYTRVGYPGHFSSVDYLRLSRENMIGAD